MKRGTVSKAMVIPGEPHNFALRGGDIQASFPLPASLFLFISLSGNNNLPPNQFWYILVFMEYVPLNLPFCEGSNTSDLIL